MFAPKNLLETCLGVKEVLAATPPGQRDVVGEDFQRMLGFDVDYYGATRLEVHSDRSYGLPDGLTMESQIWPRVEFGRSRIQGELSGVLYRRLKAVDTLVWMMVEPKFRFLEDPRLNIDDLPHPDEVVDVVEIGGRIRRPVYIPVEAIQSVLVAA